MVSPRARRQVAQAACVQGLSLRRAALLCTTARFGLRYQSKRRKRDARLAQALRGVAKRYPQWGVPLSRRLFAGSGMAFESQAFPSVCRQHNLDTELQHIRWYFGSVG